jgi:hypothetical protein
VTAEENQFQLTYACTAPELSNTEKYPSVAPIISTFIDLANRHWRICAGFFCSVVAFVQFVRSVAPLMSHGTVFAFFGLHYNRKRYFVAHLATLSMPAKSCGDSLIALIMNSEVTYGPISKQRPQEALAKIDSSKLRVIILLATVTEIKRMALLWYALWSKNRKDRWVWMTDASAANVDFVTDTPEVRADSL